MDDIRFGRYRLLGLIGRGGMGEVYRAYDTDTRREVALKLLPEHLAEDDTFRERFRREAHITAGLRDPHVTPIHAFGEIDGRLYLDMRLIDGADLTSVLAGSGGLPPESAVSYLRQVADALDAAHGQGLIHRDVKPSNILITDRDFVYLIDFGIAHGEQDTSLTAMGSAVGTLAYMAPERFRPERAGKAADVYSLACVLYECLTGQIPFPRDSLEQQVSAHMTTDPPRPTDYRDGIPPDLDEVIARGMAKRPADRFDSAGALAGAALRAVSGRPTVSRGPLPAVPLGPRRDTCPGEPMEPNWSGEPAETVGRGHHGGWLIAILSILVVLTAGSALTSNDLLGRGANLTSTVATSTVTVTATGPPSFDRIARFVRDYYALLPERRDQAWDDLDSTYAARTGRPEFDRFWSSVSAVQLDSVSPQDGSSVQVRLTYRTTDGRTETENRWVQVTLTDGRMQVANSTRLGPG
ncbi:serine/threonine-protein kinase [Skermania piniformis]|uniref:non-specific serine/threonine protein kinase n=1 Tax=Skermania pinensis TaxID=39122 RepID=A0ABX8S3J7_9ACTN|nr:serine/threonine-protein kinase [Skermania piniformis]QXQ12398.1 serine/threonine protein kinase [Skermania piniformis]